MQPRASRRLRALSPPELTPLPERHRRRSLHRIRGHLSSDLTAQLPFQSCDLASLQHDLLERLFSLLPPNSLIALSGTCLALRAFLDAKPSVWTESIGRFCPPCIVLPSAFPRAKAKAVSSWSPSPWLEIPKSAWRAGPDPNTFTGKNWRKEWIEFSLGKSIPIQVVSETSAFFVHYGAAHTFDSNQGSLWVQVFDEVNTAGDREFLWFHFPTDRKWERIPCDTPDGTIWSAEFDELESLVDAFDFSKARPHLRAVPEELRAYDPAVPFWPAGGTAGMMPGDGVEIQCKFILEAESFLNWAPATVLIVDEKQLTVYVWILDEVRKVNKSEVPTENHVRLRPEDYEDIIYGWRKMTEDDKSFWNSIFDCSFFLNVDVLLSRGIDPNRFDGLVRENNVEGESDHDEEVDEEFDEGDGHE
eukprot:CAMPEP_0174915056 /NCGR_PEP_ID=MMETSP0167-20121228/81164_1 /TAXON_ID=38298 /ORGANISM="Rhodella maculata, Strain CCMP736" /LENGTH=416 /DNA_ID=CAMNT_0016159845 /DNA_START=60 /DNA_END=1310 /DNA_ORIENTATION=-